VSFLRSKSRQACSSVPATQLYLHLRQNTSPFGASFWGLNSVRHAALSQPRTFSCTFVKWCHRPVPRCEFRQACSSPLATHLPMHLRQKISPFGASFWGTLDMKYIYRRTSISGTTFRGKKCLSETILHAVWLDFCMLFDNLLREKVSKREGYLCFFLSRLSKFSCKSNTINAR
jgi:hypothetical protein